MTKKPAKKEEAIERAGEAIWNAEFLVVIAGSGFDSGSDPFLNELCNSNLVNNVDRMMGFWGSYYNECMDRAPSENFRILANWRDLLFSSGDLRKRGKKLRESSGGAVDDTEEHPRFMVFTNLVGNYFQKAGIPSNEVMEINGNITVWQCAMRPPCTSITFSCDPAFRFYIDPVTMNAPPVKYVAIKGQSTAPQPRNDTVDFDVENIMFTDEGSRRLETLCKSSLNFKNFSAQHLRLNVGMQLIGHRFPDQFTGFATDLKAPLKTYLFGVYQENEDSCAAGTPTHPPVRVSHLLAHCNALDEHVTDNLCGDFFPVEVSTFRRDRDQYFEMIKNSYVMRDPSTLSERLKMIRYNISVVILAENEVLISSDLRKRLYSSYVSQEELVQESIAISDLQEYLNKKYANKKSHQSKMEGLSKMYYFSNVRPSVVWKQSKSDLAVEIIIIPFTAEEGKEILPKNGRVSIICETVIDTRFLSEKKKVEKKKANSAVCVGEHKTAQSVDNPVKYTANVWQLTGRITATQEYVSSNVKFVGPEGFAHTLQDRSCHTVQFCSRTITSPSDVYQLVIESPIHDNDLPQHTFSSIKKPLDQIGSPKGIDPIGNTKLLPAPNQIYCRNCHELARPYILMNRAGVRDDGFCHSVLASRQRDFKAWEKSLFDRLKQDPNNWVVLLEIGCDKKIDAVKQYSDKLYKALKTPNSMFIRASRSIAEVKTQTGPVSSDPNYLIFNDDPGATLTQINYVVNEKMKRLKK